MVLMGFRCLIVSDGEMGWGSGTYAFGPLFYGVYLAHPWNHAHQMLQMQPA